MRGWLSESFIIVGIFIACGMSAYLGYVEGRRDYERPPCPVYEVAEGFRAISITDDTLIFYNGKQYMFNEAPHKRARSTIKMPNWGEEDGR